MADRGALGKPVLITVPSLKEWWAEQDARYAAAGRDIEFTGKDNFYRLRTYLPQAESAPGPLPLAGLGTMVIADGHHRAETHARLGDRGVDFCQRVPVCIIGADELHIGIFVRLIQDPRQPAELLPALEPFFTCARIPSPTAPAEPGEWLMVCANKYFSLRRKASSPPVTDAAWLEHTVLPAVFGITDTRADERISFEPVPDGGHGDVSLFPARDRISLYGYPVTKAGFFAEVAAGRCFPPKSTRFEPRVPSGLVVWMP